ncbi:erythromycin esterase family protein [Propylenella binzhouense]|uniref:Erythromycin esterase family protein n=1 Tax=Propylenella binzhouense TaxID=2555902 RepID=A0A964WV81_9HYPH|nr:erythromycin esterase family protein [Propylenella binzhouense]MYZ49896.1 erythromycin esterase family protein [Propylenella binzhouense]
MSNVFTEERSGLGVEAAARAVRESCHSLPAPERAEAFGERFDGFGAARVVLLGEATHGTSEFYRARAAITRRLILHHGFDIVAVEADWPDAARIDRYVRDLSPRAEAEEAFQRFPTWMWRNREVLEFLDWLRIHNQAIPHDERVEFRGLDVYSMGSSIASVIRYLEEVDPEAAQRARNRYGCLTPWQEEPAHYGRDVLYGRKDPCEDAIASQLEDLLARRLDDAAGTGEGLFDAVQNARIVRAAEQYYRIMYRGSTESWNLRDRHMFETLKRLLERRGPGAKAVVWAHNSHIGNAAATAMGWQGEFNIGELCRTAFGEEAALIGFGTDRGTVAAASDWGEPMEVMQVRPARADSYERVFRQAGLARALTDWRAPARQRLRDALAEPRLERAIGVVYRPDTERTSHYFDAVLPEQFDAFVWFEETRAVTPLSAGRPQGVPETYPFGL